MIIRQHVQHVKNSKKNKSYTPISASLIFEICNPSKGSQMAHLKIGNPSKGAVSAACQQQLQLQQPQLLQLLQLLQVLQLRQLQLQLPYNYTTTTTTTAITTLQLQQHQHHHNYNYNYNYCATPHYIQELWVRWPLQRLQPLKKTQLQPPFGPSVDSLCHPWFTTTNLSYRFPISETSATASCGTTGKTDSSQNHINIAVIATALMNFGEHGNGPGEGLSYHAILMLLQVCNIVTKSFLVQDSFAFEPSQSYRTNMCLKIQSKHGWAWTILDLSQQTE